MVRPWHHLVLRLLLLSIVSQDYVQACDDECQNVLIKKFENLLDSKFNPLNTKINKLTSNFETLELSVWEMKRETDGFSGTTSRIQTTTIAINSQIRELKSELLIMTKLQENMSNKLDTITLMHGTTSSDLQKITLSNGDIHRQVIDLDIKIIEQNQFLISFNECSDGLLVEGQCFVIHQAEKTGWFRAEELCQAKGLVLAEPSDTAAVPLRRYLLQRYGKGLFWVNAQSNQTIDNFVWQRSNKTLVDNNQLLLWSTDQPTGLINASYCLTILVEEEQWKTSPMKPYQPKDCGETQHYYPLCERILQDTETKKTPFKLLEESIFTKQDTIEKKLVTINQKMVETVCPDGFLVSTQCFKLYMDRQRTWSQAKSKCQSSNYILAETNDEVAIQLRRYLMDNYGHGTLVWLGAAVSGSSWKWNSSQRELSTTHPLWYNTPPTSSGNCLLLLVSEGNWKDKPRQPYGYYSCTNTYWTLCQVRP